jgi:hypothetical protein
MDPVTVIAGRRNNQPHLQQRASVNTVHVLRRRLRVLHLVLFGKPGIAVALGARVRKIQFEYGRIGVLYRQDLVRSVAVETAGGAGRPERVTSAVNARGITLCSGLMTRPAIDRLGREVIIRMLGANVSMTTRAGVGWMRRVRQFGFLYEERNADAGGIGLEQGLIRMTIQAGRVGI